MQRGIVCRMTTWRGKRTDPGVFTVTSPPLSSSGLEEHLHINLL